MRIFLVGDTGAVGMNIGLVIAASVIVGLFLLFMVLRLVFFRVDQGLQKHIFGRFDKTEILGATTRANSFGFKSKGGAQIRGNGALVLTRNELCFVRAVPREEYLIPIGSIRKVSMPKTFNGKSVFVPLLRVDFDSENGEESIAWALKRADKWKDAIEKMIM